MPTGQASATLVSWNETPATTAIVEFVERVSDESGPDYVPPAERIAVFDNDGTLWCEKPIQIEIGRAARCIRRRPDQAGQDLEPRPRRAGRL